MAYSNYSVNTTTHYYELTYLKNVQFYHQCLLWKQVALFYVSKPLEMNNYVFAINTRKQPETSGHTLQF